VHDGVLDQRLQHEVRHERVHHIRIDIGVHVEPALEAHLHDVEIELQQLQLARQRDLLLARPLERHAQQFAQTRDHATHAARVALHERRHRVQRVEQEVRVQLRTQHREPRLRELRLQLCRLRGQPNGLVVPRSISREDVARDTRREHCEIHGEVIEKPETQETRAPRDGRAASGTHWKIEHRVAHEVRRDIHEHGRQHADTEEEQHATEPIPARLETDPARHPEDRDGQHRPQIVLGERKRDRRGRRERLLEGRAARVEQPARRRQNRENGPEREDEQQLGPLQGEAAAVAVARSVSVREGESRRNHVSTIRLEPCARQVAPYERHQRVHGLHGRRE